MSGKDISVQFEKSIFDLFRRGGEGSQEFDAQHKLEETPAARDHLAENNTHLIV